MKLHKLLILALAFISFSCDDFVDIEPKGAAIAENLNDIDLLLSDGTNLSGVGAIRFNIPALISDNALVSDPDLENLAGAYFGVENHAIYTLQDIFVRMDQRELEWASYYECIARCNYIIDAVYKVTGDENKKKSFEAEAKVHKGFAYFCLVNIYGHHYKTDHASKPESGVPVLNKFADLTEDITRKSADEVYQLIEEWVTTAIPNLNDAKATFDRVNKAAAQAFLSRIHLHKGEYDKALAMANEALKYNSTLFDYDKLGSYVPKWKDNPEYVLFKSAIFMDVGNYPNVKGLVAHSPELEALYKHPTKDCRIAKFAHTDKHGNLVYANKNYRSMERAIGVTVPELMLIKAECLARAGNFNEAIDVVNQLRKNRFIADAVADNSYKVTATNKDEAIKVVLEERRREFHNDGRRFLDIKRLNAIENAGISITRKGKTWAPNSINWAAPIPAKVVFKSEGKIKQNERE